MLHVLLKTDSPGAAKILCESLGQDPLFPDKVVLKGLIGLSWPVGGKYIKVVDWSIPKSNVLNYMSGPIRNGFEITPEMLAGEKKEIPYLEGTQPAMDLISHPEEVAAKVQKPEKPEPEPAAVAKDPPPPIPRQVEPPPALPVRKPQAPPPVQKPVPVPTNPAPGPRLQPITTVS